MLKFRPKKLKKLAKRSVRALALAFAIVVLVIVCTPIANIMARPLIVAGEPGRSDVIVVLGGGAYADGSLGGASNERLIRAVVLYNGGYAGRIHFAGGSILKLSRKLYNTASGGGERLDVVESEVMRGLAVGMGVPLEATSVDAASRRACWSPRRST